MGVYQVISKTYWILSLKFLELYSIPTEQRMSIFLCVDIRNPGGALLR
jgi:hypothetical protein